MGSAFPPYPSLPSFTHSFAITVDFSGCRMSSHGLRNGIVVAVSLNPAASTSFVDPGLNKLASEIAVRKYVAILSGIVRPSPLSRSVTPLVRIGKRGSHAQFFLSRA